MVAMSLAATSSNPPDDLSISELRQIATRQQQQIEVQLKTLREREAQLTNLRRTAGSKWTRGVDAVDLRLKHLISRVDSQENQLNRLRALRQQLDHFRHANDLLESELSVAKTDFESKKNELREVSSRIDRLRIQMERARKPLPAPPDRLHQPSTDERLAKLRESVMRKRQESAVLRKEAINHGLQPPSSPPLSHKRPLTHAPRHVITNTYFANKGSQLSNSEVLQKYKEAALQAYKEKVEAQASSQHGNGDSGNEDTCSTSDTNSQTASSDALQTSSPVEVTRETLSDLILADVDEEETPLNNLIVSEDGCVDHGAPIASMDDLLSDTDSSSGRGSPTARPAILPPLPVTPPHNRSDSVSSHSTATNSVSGILLKPGKESVRSSRSVTFAPLAVLLDAAMEADREMNCQHHSELELVVKTAELVDNLSGSNEEGITALHNAVCAAHIPIVEYLLSHGADVNAADSDGWTALHCAASCHSLPLCRILVEAGAVLHSTTLTDSESALDFTQEGSPVHLYLTEELQRLGVDREGRVFSAFDYTTEESDELLLKRCQQLTVLKKGDQTESDWYWCMDPVTKNEGYVARNFITLYCPGRLKQQQQLIDNLVTTTDSTVSSSS